MTQLTTEQQIAILNLQLDLYFTQVSLERGYSSADSCVSYINSTVLSWKNEATAYSEWRDAAYETINPIINAIPPEGPVPTVDKVTSQVTPIVWPAL